jgi:hypothetical protein
MINVYRNALKEFINGVPHAKGVHLIFLLPFSILSIFLLFLKKPLPPKITYITMFIFSLLLYFGIIHSGFKQIYTIPILILLSLLAFNFSKERIIPILLLTQIIIALWYGFSFFQGWQEIFKWFPGLRMFNFSRFFFLSEMLWAILFAFVIRELNLKLYGGKLFAFTLILLQIIISFKLAFFSIRTKEFYLPYNKYYAQEQFIQIKNYIGKNPKEYRIVSFGIPPAVPQYNGMMTLGGYMVNYPLEYKHEFRKIIENFLRYNPFYRNIFDVWGSKLYLFNNEVQFPYKSESEILTTHYKQYDNIDLNFNQIVKMGADYLISAQKIKQPNRYGLELLEKFSDKNSLWNIFLYKINLNKSKLEIL